MINKNKNILITGIPRSGTSLIIKLLSLDDKNICFSEPPFIRKIKHISDTKKEVCQNLGIKIEGIRKRICYGGAIEIRVGKNGELPDNYFGKRKINNITKIQKTSKIKETILPKSYYKNIIIIKNNLLFTSCLDELVKKYEIIAIIRNPLSILKSWLSLDLPISKGIVKSGLKYSKTLKEITNKKDLTLKQIAIIDWFYAQYKDNNKIHLIKYEELIQSPYLTLESWISNSTILPKLTSQNIVTPYTKNDLQMLKIIQNTSELYNTYYIT